MDKRPQSHIAMPTEAQIQAVALLAATAYWQGRLAQRRQVQGSIPVDEGMILRSAEADAWQWVEKAREAMENNNAATI